MNAKKFFEALNIIEKDKGVPREVVLEAFKQGIISAYRKNYGKDSGEVRVEVDEETAKIGIFAKKTVVEEVNNPTTEISVEDAHKISKSAKLGDVIDVEVTPKNFGRIAIQAAKQRVLQAVIEAERDVVYNRYKDNVEDMYTLEMTRHDDKNVYLQLTGTDGILPKKEMLPQDEFIPNGRLKVVMTRIEKTTKGPIIFLSRTTPLLVKRLFEDVVPEIQDGIIEIKAIARDPGDRSKVLVKSYDENVDPIGACIGPNQARINLVIKELKGEKIDLALWSSDPKELIANALQPARVVAVKILDEKNKQSLVIVPDDQLSLAIGRKGQNARLAHQLTGWKIDIKSVKDAQKLGIKY